MDLRTIKRKRAIKAARKDFYAFCRFVCPRNKWALFQKELCDILTKSGRSSLAIKVAKLQGEDPPPPELNRLYVGMPPQHAKSTIVAQLWVCWMLGQDPTFRIAVGSYSGDKAGENVEFARRIMVLAKYREIFPGVEIERCTKNPPELHTTAGGIYFGRGADSAITGKTVDLMIVDDPYSGATGTMSAMSPAARKTVWDWWVGSVKSRATPWHVRVIIMTRWHDDDLVGRIEKAEKTNPHKENWHTIIFKGECEAQDIDPATGKDRLGREVGQFLWEEWYPKQKYYEAKQDNALLWYAMYQQKPRIEGGNLVGRDKIQYVARDEVPDYLPKARYWDLATSKKQSADFTVGALAAFDAAEDSKRLYLYDIDRFQLRWAEAKARIRQKAITDYGTFGEPVPYGIEVAGQQGVAYDELQPALAGVTTLRGTRPTAKKEVRALPWLSIAQTQRLVIVCERDPETNLLVKPTWCEPFLDELEGFPNGVNDDQMDALSGVHEMLNGAAAIGLVQYT